MKDQKVNALIGSFLFEKIDNDSQNALIFFSELEYPCPDMKEFRQRILKTKTKELRFLHDLFEPEDFPMVSPQNAFEKFSKRGRHRVLSGVRLPKASLTVLADAVANGGMTIDGTDIVFRMAADGGVNVKCNCSEVVGPDGSTGATGSCSIDISGDIVSCSQGTCSGSCSMRVSVPSLSLRNFGAFASS